MLLIPLLAEMEALSQEGTPVRQRHFLRFGKYHHGKEDVNLKEPRTITLLAWVIQTFVPLVITESNLFNFWDSLKNRAPISTFVSVSDLSFVILVLEHHINKWRIMGEFKRRTRRFMPERLARNIGGLLYPGGIAGKEAKRRFVDLQVYFQLTFYSINGSKANANMRMLQWALGQQTPPGAPFVLPPQPTTEEIANDVLHRVFHHLHMT